MELQQILDDIATQPTVPVWPHLGKALGVSRNTAYDAARKNEVEVIRVGSQYRVVSASLRKRLGIEPK